MFNFSFPLSALQYSLLVGKWVIQPGEWPLSASVKLPRKNSLHFPERKTMPSDLRWEKIWNDRFVSVRCSRDTSLTRT